MGGRGSTGQRYRQYTFDNSGRSNTSSISKAYTNIRFSPVGSKVVAHYSNGGSSTYTMTVRGGKGVLVSDTGRRKLTIQTESSIRKFIGQPYKIDLYVASVTGKQTFNQQRRGN